MASKIPFKAPKLNLNLATKARTEAEKTENAASGASQEPKGTTRKEQESR